MLSEIRRIFLIGLAIVTLSLLTFSFAPLPIAMASHSASASCSGDDLEVSWSGATAGAVIIFGSGPGLPGVAVGSGSSGSMSFTGPGTWFSLSVGDFIDTVSLPDTTCPTSSGGGGGGTTGGDDDEPGPPFIPGDDRLNVDAASPVAVYCRDDGIHVFTIDSSGKGHLAFIASFNQINAVGIPTVNTLIASGGGVGLYRLASGEFQVNSTRISSAQPKVQAQESGQVIHIVQRGENLFRLAIRYNTTVQAIAAANGIVDVTRIYVGQRLIIPVGNTTPGTQPGTTGTNQPAPSSASIGAGYVFIFNGC